MVFTVRLDQALGKLQRVAQSRLALGLKGISSISSLVHIPFAV